MNIFLKLDGRPGPTQILPGDVLVVGRGRCRLHRPSKGAWVALNLWFNIDRELVRVIPIYPPEACDDIVDLLVNVDRAYHIDLSANGSVHWTRQVNAPFDLRLSLLGRRKYIAAANLC